MALLFVVQAAGQTHLTGDSPEINSENLLALLAPMVFVYGVALFYTLLDQLNLVTVDTRGAVVGVFILAMCAPLLMSFLVGHRPSAHTPYSPLHIRRVAWLMQRQGIHDQRHAWRPWPGTETANVAGCRLDDDQEFYQFNRFKPIKAVYLTQRTTDSRFLSQMMLNPKSWGHFVVECEAHGEVPSGFPLTKALAGFLPDQMLVSDQPRWRMPP